MSEEEMDAEWDKDREDCLRMEENMDNVYPNKGWSDEDWEIYGEFLFRSYNKAYPDDVNCEVVNED